MLESEEFTANDQKFIDDETKDQALREESKHLLFD